MAKADLTGRRFGLLTVIREATPDDAEKYNVTYRKDHTMWFCQCDCGNFTVRSSGNFSDHSSCGCYQKNRMRNKYKEYIGKRYGKLVVESVINIDNHMKLKCLCDCGNIYNARLPDLISGHVKSCGCYGKSFHESHLMELQYKDLSGKTFGHLTAIEPLQQRSTTGNIIWRCLCDCGNSHDVSSASLLSGNTQSCGCVKSRGESKIATLLNANGIKFKKQFWFDDLRSDSHSPYYFDFGIISNNGHLEYLVEYDGVQHFKANNYGWNTDDCYKGVSERDQVKNQYCVDHGIPLIRIPYTKLDNLCFEDLCLQSTDFLCVG